MRDDTKQVLLALLVLLGVFFIGPVLIVLIIKWCQFLERFL